MKFDNNAVISFGPLNNRLYSFQYFLSFFYSYYHYGNFFFSLAVLFLGLSCFLFSFFIFFFDGWKMKKWFSFSSRKCKRKDDKVKFKNKSGRFLSRMNRWRYFFLWIFRIVKKLMKWNEADLNYYLKPSVIFISLCFW